MGDLSKSLLSKVACAFIGVLSIVGSDAWAQTVKFKPQYMLGVTGGANLSNVIFIPTVRQVNKYGYDAGMVFRIDVESYVGLWLEANYSVRGWKEAPEDFPEYSYERTTTYISVPFMTHFMIGKGPMKLTLDMGPQFGYFISEHSVSTFPKDPVPGVATRQHEMPVEKKFAWGLGGGPGVEYHFKHLILGLRGSYYYGLGDFYRNTRKDYFGKSSEQIYSLKAYFLYNF